MELIIALIAGLALGALIGWLVSRAGTAAALATAEQERGARESLAVEINKLREQLAAVQGAKVAAETELKNARESIDRERSLLDDAKAKLSDAFSALAAEALGRSNEEFLKLAGERLGAVSAVATGDVEARKKEIETLVKPLGDSLEKMNAQIQALEKARSFAYGELGNQVKSLITTQTELRSETANLVKALRAPQVRGRWGEVQLKRVVELAGMLERCDFYQQESVDTDTGRLRPDLRVQLPGSRSIIVDAKTPLLAYLEALEAPTEELRTAKLKEHARQVRDHMAKLEAKAYWEQFQPAPQFVVMFLPGETFFSAALEQDPSLIEAGRDRVILATPTTLIALLRAVAYGWMQQETAENADRIRILGRELYERLATVVAFLDDVGTHLGRSIDSFNKAVASFESRVAPSARRFKELGIASDKEIELSPIDKVPRRMDPVLSDESALLVETPPVTERPKIQ
ncbi:MAG TPA: DNA recombination protein RmuC [Candidatus Binataceae bacterium]|nr:DNA recombination protein RmuC [Candidatus Binataceae bacterium]